MICIVHKKKANWFLRWSIAFPEIGLNKISHLDSEWHNVPLVSSQKGNSRPPSAVNF